MTKTVWMLDIDGVLNTFTPSWGLEELTHVKVARTPIRYAPPLIDRIQAVHRAGLVEIRWSTTWCGYPVQLAALEDLFGLHIERAFGDRPMSKTWAELKCEAAVAVVEAGDRLIWTDDDEVGVAPSFYPVIGEAVATSQALLIQPESELGLQPDHLDAIEAFAANLETAA